MAGADRDQHERLRVEVLFRHRLHVGEIHVDGAGSDDQVRDALHRAYRVANAIDALGIAPGERIATLAWNGYRHFELYYGVSGSERILHTLNPRLTAEQLAWIVADADDPAALEAMCLRTRVMVSTVGPYALYGEPLIAACVRTGIDYCDLTGEVQWIRRMIERYEAEARASGARIVHCCGFDSIPSDLGVAFVQRECQRRFGATAERVNLTRWRNGACPAPVR